MSERRNEYGLLVQEFKYVARHVYVFNIFFSLIPFQVDCRLRQSAAIVLMQLLLIIVIIAPFD